MDTDALLTARCVLVSQFDCLFFQKLILNSFTLSFSFCFLFKPEILKSFLSIINLLKGEINTDRSAEHSSLWLNMKFETNGWYKLESEVDGGN
jgi:hypothetical protein